jgi:FlaA1/EpsC-like NDP-sugar epimerase
VLLVLYFDLPMDRFADHSVWLTLGFGLIVLVAFSSFQISRILKSSRPGARAVEGLAMTVPLYLLMFSAIYYILERSAPESFDVSSLTKLDALYFTVTVFTTVGFGDITATSELARGVVTVQMLLNLLVIGLGVRVFFGAVQEAWRRQQSAAEVEGSDAGDAETGAGAVAGDDGPSVTSAPS